MKIRLHTDFHSRPPRIFQRQENGSYYIRQQIQKREYWRSLHTANKKIAEQLAYKIWYHQQGQTMRGILETPLEPLEEAMIQYQSTDSWENLKPSTQATKEKIWKSFTVWADKHGIKHVQDVTPELGEMFLNTRGKTNKTNNNILNDLRQTFSEICRLSKYENPFSKIKPGSISKGTRASWNYRAFTDGEIEAILKYIPTSRMRYRDEWLAACHIARFTGLRFKDVALLQWSRIHLDADRPYIETIPHKTETITGKSVIFSVIPQLAEVLRNSERSSFYVLPGLSTNYNENTSSKYFCRILKNLNITGIEGKHVGFHSFRSTVTTKAARAGIDLKLFGGVLGHTEEKQTESYNKASIDIDLSFLAG